MLSRARPVLTAALEAFGGHPMYVLRGPEARAQGPSGQTALVRSAGPSTCCASSSSSVRRDDSSTHLMGLCSALGSSPGWRWRLSVCDWAAGVGQVGRLTSLRQADASLPVSGRVDSAWYRHVGNCPQDPLRPGPAWPTGHPTRAKGSGSLLAWRGGLAVKLPSPFPFQVFEFQNHFCIVVKYM